MNRREKYLRCARGVMLMGMGLLLAQLSRNSAWAAETPSTTLSTGTAQPPTIDQLLADLQSSDALVRERAIRRLLPQPENAAGKVVDAFAHGPLRARVATLDLLRAWKSPLAGMDPWQPDTISEELILGLRVWATHPPANPVAGPTTLPKEDLIAARSEITRYVNTAAPDDRQAMLERLSRLGPALLPEVINLGDRAATDQARERLTLLRYRLVACDSLVLTWNDGLERLASSDANLRHSAVDELAKRATPQDGPLLIQVFHDPDPLVREMGLRGLRQVGGSAATSALAGLLDDPEPNVRAAVLGQLTENPDPALIPRIVAYVAREKDVDLLGHAIRALAAAKDLDDDAIGCLIKLAGNENWRIRGEAVEALKDHVGRGDSINPEVATLLIKALDDPDGFVAGRAVLTLQKQTIPNATLALVKAAEKHPQLAGDVIKALIHDEKTAKAAIPYLKKFCRNEMASVRTSAITGLVAVTKVQIDPELTAAIRDPDRNVRIAGANGISDVLEALRPQDLSITRHVGGFLGFGGSDVREKIDMNLWVANFCTGTNRPVSMTAFVPDLQKMLAAANPEESVAAAIPLVALGHESESWVVLNKKVESQPKLAENAAAALPWLSLPKRLEFFDLLIPHIDEGEIYTLVRAMIANQDDPSAQAVWKLVSKPGATIGVADTVYSQLQSVYGGNEFENSSPISTPPNAHAAMLVAKASQGAQMQRLVALALLVRVSLPDAGLAARKVLDDPAAPSALHADAFKILLMCAKDNKTRDSMAVAALGHKDFEVRKAALYYLGMGSEQLRQLRDSMYISYYSNDNEYDQYGYGKPIVVTAPAGLTAKVLRPWLQNEDTRAAAIAGYLLATLKDSSGWTLFLAEYKRQAVDNAYDQTWRRMMYRTIAALDDDTLTPELENIYALYKSDSYQVREMYWTIRSMQGSKVYDLRKKIRAQIGMDRLK